MVTVQDVIEKLNMIAPFESQFDYDNSGLQIGSPADEVKKLGVCLDLNLDLAKAAHDNGITTILTHHPVIFRPIKALTTSDYRYELITYCIKAGISVISCHTNFDKCPLSNSVTLLKKLGLGSVELIPGEDCGAIGMYDNSMTCEQFVQKLQNAKFRYPFVLHLFGQRAIKSVYAIAGAGGRDERSIYTAADAADVFISAEFKHSNLEIARAMHLNIVEMSHYDSEIGFEQTVREYMLKYFGNQMPIFILSNKY